MKGILRIGGEVMDEAQAIEGCKNGIMEFYTYLIKEYESSLYKYCYYLTGNSEEARDLYQTTWVKVMTNINKYSKTYSFKNWLLSIATNTFKDNYRRRKRWSTKLKQYNDTDYKEKDFQQVIDTGPLPEESYDMKESKGQLNKAIQGLKQHYKTVILLFYFEEKTIKEISFILQIPEGTVKSRLNQGKKILHKAMEVKDHEDR